MGKAPAVTKRPHGGQLAINPLRMARILRALAGGNYIKTACAYAGITPHTYRNWLNIGEAHIEEVRATGVDPEEAINDWLEQPGNEPGSYQDDAKLWKAPGPKEFDPYRWPCVLFVTLAERASAQAEVAAVAQVRLAGPNNWAAAMTFLERRHPEKWGRRDRVAMEGVQGGAPIQVQQVPSLDQLEDAVVRLMERNREMQQRAARNAGELPAAPVEVEAKVTRQRSPRSPSTAKEPVAKRAATPRKAPAKKPASPK